MNEAFDKKKRNHDMRGIKETQKFKLGDAQGTPRQYFKKSQASKLGDAPVGRSEERRGGKECWCCCWRRKVGCLTGHP